MIARRRISAESIGADRVSKVRHASLPEGAVRERIGIDRRIVLRRELEHAAVARVRYIDVADAVERDCRRIAQGRRADRAQIAGPAGETSVLPIDEVRIRVAGAWLSARGVEWRVVEKHAIVPRVRDVQIPTGVDADSTRAA